VISANKFLQKIWNLNYLISNRKGKEVNENLEKKFTSHINKYVNKIDNSINNFRFNVTIAYFYEVYKIFKDHLEENISNNILKQNIIKIMKMMIPFIPHLAYECLELFDCKTANNWPKIEKNFSEDVNLAVQINGKTRDIITINKDLNEKAVNQIIKNESKAKKYIENKKIIKTIFVKNKIINYIISN